MPAAVRESRVFRPFIRESDPDAPLVNASRAGDVHAFDMLVRRYQERLSLFVRARLDSAIDPADVAQEILVDAWCKLPQFEGRSRFKTWLFGIAINHCAEARRRHRVVPLVLLEGEDANELPRPWMSRVDPRDWSAVMEEREAVQKGLRTLPEPERQILELYYYGQLNLPEIAKLLDVNLNTLKYRFYQAHRRLRSCLEAWEREDDGGLTAPCVLMPCGRRQT